MPKPAVPPSACLVGAVPPSGCLVGAVSPSAFLVAAVPPSAFLVHAVPPSAPPGGAGPLRSGLRGPFSGRGNPHRVRAAGGGAAAGRFGRRRPLGPLAGGVGAEHAGAGHLLRFGRGGQAAGGRAAGERPARADLVGAGGRPPRCRTPRSPPLGRRRSRGLPGAG